MTKAAILMALVILPLALSACNKPADKAKTEASVDGMGDMAMPVRAKMAKGFGKVTSIDAAAGKITLDHGPIAELGWPAMKMSFSANSQLLGKVKVGDAVTFEIIWNGKSGTVTNLMKKGK